MQTAISTQKKKAAILSTLGYTHTWHTLTWILMGIGICFRLFHFFNNRSFWIDEIYLSNSLIRMSFLELLGALEYEQKAPIGYLWAVKVCVLLFGKQEMALRLFPLLCGMASLLVFLPVARRFLDPLGVFVAMGILSLAPPLVYHSVEAKQYSAEAFATIVALYLYIRFHQKNDTVSLLLWGIWGALLIWFSFTVIFILAGMAMGICLYYLINREWKLLFRSIPAFVLWMVSFLVNYLLFTNQHAGSEWLLDWFTIRDSFMPLPPTNAEGIKWFFRAFYNLFRYPLGMAYLQSEHPNLFVKVLIRMPFLPVLYLFLVVGLYSFFKKDRKLLLVLITPVLLAFVASGFKIYPFYERSTIYLGPLFILILAQGCYLATHRLKPIGKLRYSLAALLLLSPLVGSATELINPELFGDYKSSSQRSAFLYINEKVKPGDVVYVNWNSYHAYRYYKEAYNLKYSAIQGSDTRFISNSYQEYIDNLSPELERLAGKARVWVIYHRRVWLKIGDFDLKPDWYFKETIAGGGRVLHNKFLSMGKELDTYQRGEYNVSLFDLSAK